LDKDENPAKPGDLLAVEICNLGPLPRDEWGFAAYHLTEKMEVIPWLSLEMNGVLQHII
jgi:formamidase